MVCFIVWLPASENNLKKKSLQVSFHIDGKTVILELWCLEVSLAKHGQSLLPNKQTTIEETNTHGHMRRECSGLLRQFSQED